MEFPEVVTYLEKQKAFDYALWLDFIHRTKQKTFSVINFPDLLFLKNH